MVVRIPCWFWVSLEYERSCITSIPACLPSLYADGLGWKLGSDTMGDVRGTQSAIDYDLTVLSISPGTPCRSRSGRSPPFDLMQARGLQKSMACLYQARDGTGRDHERLHELGGDARQHFPCPLPETISEQRDVTVSGDWRLELPSLEIRHVPGMCRMLAARRSLAYCQVLSPPRETNLIVPFPAVDQHL